MSSNRIFRENQVILVCDLREFCATLSSITKNSKKGDKFFSYMDFYLKSLFEMMTAVIEFLNGKPIANKKEITSKFLYNSTGDGALLIIGGMPSSTGIMYPTPVPPWRK